MKKLLLGIISIGFTTAIQAQSLQFVDGSGNDITGTTVTTIGGNAPFTTLTAYAKIKNVSSGDIDVKVKRYETSVTPNSQNYFCWFVCYAAQDAGVAPEWPTPQDPQFNHFRTIDADSTDSALSAYHKPEGTTGISTYRYVAFDGNNPNDSTYIDFVFDVGMDDVNEANVKTSAKHFPNPSNNELNIHIESNKTQTYNVTITDMLGKQINQLNGQNALMKLDVSQYNNGIYFYTISGKDGVLMTKKFVVRH